MAHGRQVLEGIMREADQIRGDDRSKGSWKAAVREAAARYRQRNGIVERPRRPTVRSQVKNNPELDALYRGYRLSLARLRQEYSRRGLSFLPVNTRLIKGAPRRVAVPRIAPRQTVPMLPYVHPSTAGTAIVPYDGTAIVPHEGSGMNLEDIPDPLLDLAPRRAKRYREY